jgi:hypothetical protein
MRRVGRPGPGYGSDSTQTAAQLAAAALKACSIMQQQLAGLGAAEGAAVGDGGTGGLLFVDPELLNLKDPQQHNIMMQGLKVRGIVRLKTSTSLPPFLPSCPALAASPPSLLPQLHCHDPMLLTVMCRLFACGTASLSMQS